MGIINRKGVKFLHDRCTPMSVNSMDDATRVIQQQLEKGPSPNITPEQWARHLAWIIGFDHLIADRKAVHGFVSLLVED